MTTALAMLLVGALAVLAAWDSWRRLLSTRLDEARADERAELSRRMDAVEAGVEQAQRDAAETASRARNAGLGESLGGRRR